MLLSRHPGLQRRHSSCLDLHLQFAPTPSGGVPPEVMAGFLGLERRTLRSLAPACPPEIGDVFVENHGQKPREVLALITRKTKVSSRPSRTAKANEMTWKTDCYRYTRRNYLVVIVASPRANKKAADRLLHGNGSAKPGP